MKKRILYVLISVLLAALLCSCADINEKPVTLGDSITLPEDEDGIISASVFQELKEQNKAVTFKGRSGDIDYCWVIFGGDIKEVKELNLGIEITEADSEKAVFHYLSKENFGFSPALSVYLNDLWDAQSAEMCKASDTSGKEKQSVSITGKKQTILTFSSAEQTGEYIIVPKPECGTEAAVKDTEADTKAVTDRVISDAQTTAQRTQQNSETETYEEQVVKSDGSSPGTSIDATSEALTTTGESKRPVSNGKDTEQDKYKTDPVPEGKPLPVEPDAQETDKEKTFTCMFSIECSTILNNIDELDTDKLDVLPSDGIIFAQRAVTFYEGESVYDVLERVCRENKIHMEASWTPMYNSAYVEGIGNLYEFDCGSGSGWMYRVDGWYPNYGCSRYQLQDGETVEWRYTCDLGSDIGGGYAIGG